MRTLWVGFRFVLCVCLFILPALLVVIGGSWVVYFGPVWSKWTLLGVSIAVLLGLVCYGLGWILEAEGYL